ncbi:MAG: phosphoadenylyl-sulfate reductase [Deltaproteobacteria bacterium]|nr:phosphoadenylyl-sulfate reductase [Deltaproteobacteria bacterium]
MSTKEWTDEELRAVNASLEGKGPDAALRWVVDNFDRDEFALACSFSECVLVDMLVGIRPGARIFYLDTGLLFKETYEVIEKVCCKYGISVERYTPRLTVAEMEREYGPELWKRDPDQCCEIRKTSAMRAALGGLKLWITGLRREESATRASAPIVGRDVRFGIVKVNPIAAWTRKEVWDYIVRNDVPYNPLLDQGYPSIGCKPCTEPVKTGEDERAGRWAGRAKIECGLHK